MTSFDPLLRAVYRRISLENRKKACKRSLLRIGVMLAAIYLLFGKVFAISIVRGASMEPLLHNGDVAVFTRLGRHQVGDVVMLRMQQTNYVKRIIAMDDDVITINAGDGQVLVNGQRERYSNESTYGCRERAAFSTTVPANSIFVLGDNRPISKDSREFGSVDDTLVMGTLLWVIHTGSVHRSIQSTACKEE